MPPIATAPTISRRDVPIAATVTDAMITDVKVSNARTTVRELWELFADDHVHAAVIVENGVLLTVVVRTDLAGNHHDAAAARLGSLRGRVVAADANLEQARQHLLTSGGRRLAVVAADGRFCGLLCLKRSRQGFCSDVDVRARGLEDRARDGSSRRSAPAQSAIIGPADGSPCALCVVELTARQHRANIETRQPS